MRMMAPIEPSSVLSMVRTLPAIGRVVTAAVVTVTLLTLTQVSLEEKKIHF